MKHNSDVPGQLALFAIASTQIRTTIYDPAWDEILAPQQEEVEQRWNPADFGEVPHKLDPDGQVSIFYEDIDEPPDPDDFKNLDDYHQAWAEWEILVRAQVTLSTVSTRVQTPVRAQVSQVTKEIAPEQNTHWVEKYWVKRNENKYWYFRYCWMVGRKKKRIHLGSVDSIIAKRKKADIEVWIADGLTPMEIKKLIHSATPNSLTPNS